MKLLLIACCLVVMAAFAATVGHADVPGPKTKSSPKTETKVAMHTRLEIATDSRGRQARLQLSQSDLQHLRAALDGTQPNSTIAASIVNNPTRTIIAGALLFLAVSFIGVFLARFIFSATTTRGRKAVAGAIVIVATVSAAAMITQANAPAPYYFWRNLPQNLSKGLPTTGEITVEIVPDGTNQTMKLILPLQPASAPGEE